MVNNKQTFNQYKQELLDDAEASQPDTLDKSDWRAILQAARVFLKYGMNKTFEILAEYDETHITGGSLPYLPDGEKMCVPPAGYTLEELVSAAELMAKHAMKLV